MIINHEEEHEGHEDLLFKTKGRGLSGNKLPTVFREEVRPEDCENVRRIVSSSGFFSPEEVRVAVELVEERLNKGLESGYHFLFAEYNDHPVGYACFGPIACTRASYDLYWIAVIDELRNLGIGRELLTKSLELIEKLGGARIYVETSSRPQYGPTRAFYSNHGFEIEAVLKDFYDRADHKMIYVRTSE